MTDNSNLSRRRFLQATGGAATAVALAGCTDNGDGNQEDPTETTSGISGNTLSLTNSTMTTLDPIAATDTASGRVIQNVHDALMNYPNGEVEPVNLLAEDYETSDDNTTYTFNLKQGAKYHNGDEVTAQDVVYSFERLAQSSNSQRTYFILDSIGVTHETDTVTTEEENEDGEMEEVEHEVYSPGTLGVSAEDDYTVTMELDKPFHSTLPMLAYTSFSVIPEGIIGDIEGYDGEVEQTEFANDPVGCGPFVFDNWEANTQCDISRFDDYHGEVANVEGVHWQIIEDPDALYNYGQNGNADIITIPTAQYDPNKIQNTETDDMGRTIGEYGPIRDGETMVDYLAVATINTYYIGFNTSNVEKPARQAAAYALNQQTIVDQVFKGRGATSYMLTPPSIYPGGANAYREKAESDYPYGYNETLMDEARQVMEDAGYSENNRYEFTFTTYESNTWEDMAGILRDQLASCHIDMQIESAPFSTLLQRGMNGNLDAYSLGWVMDWPAPDNFLQLLNPPQTDTSRPDPISYLDWSGTEAADNATEAWQTVSENMEPTDEAEQARNDAYIQMEEANWEDVAFLNVYHAMEERFSYKWLDIAPFGGGGPSRQKLNKATVNDRE